MMQCRDTAHAIGLLDRGTLDVGMKVRPPKLTVAFSQSSYIVMTYRVVGARPT